MKTRILLTLLALVACSFTLIPTTANAQWRRHHRYNQNNTYAPGSYYGNGSNYYGGVYDNQNAYPVHRCQRCGRVGYNFTFVTRQMIWNGYGYAPYDVYLCPDDYRGYGNFYGYGGGNWRRH